MSWQNAFPLPRAFCVRGAQGHFGRPVCTPTSAVRCRFRLLATLLLIGLPQHTNFHQTHPPATQLSYSRSRVPVCLRVLPVPERVPCEPYFCRYYFPSSPARPLLLVFFQVYRAELPTACQCQRFDACHSWPATLSEDLTASATAQQGQRSDISSPAPIFCVLADL